MPAASATFPPAIMADATTPTSQPLLPDQRDIDRMRRIAQGDERAFRELVEQYQHAVVGTAAKMLGDPTEAEDIAQQVFLRIWRHAKSYRPEAKFTTYLFTITRNLVFNESRRKSRRRESSIEEREDHHQQTGAPEAEQPDAQLVNEELRSAVDQAIASLPETQRVAVVLRRYENMPYEEIAEVLELTVPAVKSLLFRARTTLREALRQYLDD